MRTVNEHLPREVVITDRPLLVSVPEAARLLGVGVSFGWFLVRNGDLPTIRLGRRVLVPRGALEQLASGYEPHES
jgi:excisionase family DNA binding protein